MNYQECECYSWSRWDTFDIENHHPTCEYHSPQRCRERALSLLLRLRQGVLRWAAEEDGIPDFMVDTWTDFSKALNIEQEWES